MSRILGSFDCKRFIKLGFAFLIVMFLSPTLRAQLVRGSVSGSVMDPQDIAVAGATITLTNQEKGEA